MKVLLGISGASGAAYGVRTLSLLLARGVELHVDADHPLARVGPLEADVAEAVRQALTKLLPTAPA